MIPIARKPTLPDPKQNNILAMLPAEDFDRVVRHLQLFELPLGHVLYESGDVLPYVYFPVDSIVSLIYVMEDGSSDTGCLHAS